MKNKLSICLFFEDEELLVILINSLDKKILSQFDIPFREIVPSLVELISLKLSELQFDFSCVNGIYLAQKESRWNSNRLVVAFVQSLAFALPINIYKRNFELSEELDYHSNWVNFLNSFKEIDWRELEPLYNKCPITNI